MSLVELKVLQASDDFELEPIPNKLYFTISEVSSLCKLKPHILRYWEQEFSQLKPIKRRGNRRYYQSKDIQLVRRIRNLLYKQGFTIEGAKGKLANTELDASEKIYSKAHLRNLVKDLELILLELEKE